MPGRNGPLASEFVYKFTPYQVPVVPSHSTCGQNMSFNPYVRILAVSPEHVQALHNLCVVEVERGNLEEAEQCLVRASQLAPHQDYILKHLAIVRGKLRRKLLPPLPAG
jgi:hypothetical protein